MIEGCRTGPQGPSERTVAIGDDTFEVDAALIGELLHLEPARVPVLMREGAITSASERGLDAHAGEFRLTFFYGNRRARLTTDMTGRVIRRSAVDIAERPAPAVKAR